MARKIARKKLGRHYLDAKMTRVLTADAARAAFYRELTAGPLGPFPINIKDAYRDWLAQRSGV